MEQFLEFLFTFQVLGVLAFVAFFALFFSCGSWWKRRVCWLG